MLGDVIAVINHFEEKELFSKSGNNNKGGFEMTLQQIKYEFCNIHDEYVETERQYFCKNCIQYLCSECYENRKKHECILVEEDVL